MYMYVWMDGCLRDLLHVFRGFILMGIHHQLSVNAAWDLSRGEEKEEEEEEEKKGWFRL